MLTVRKWEPVEYVLDGNPIKFEVRRLSFLQAKRFDVPMARVRFDVVGNELDRIAEETAAAERAKIGTLEGIAHGAGLFDAAEPLKRRGLEETDEGYIKRLAEALDAAGVPVPVLSVEEREAEVARLSALNARRSTALQTFYDSLPDGFVTDAFREYVRKVEGISTEDGPITTGLELLDVADQGLVVFALVKIKQLAELSVSEGNDSGSRSISEPVPAPGAGTAGPVAGPDSSTRAIAPGTQVAGS